MPSIADLVLLAEREVSRRFKKNMPLRERQREVLALLAARRNVFAGLPTGYGKSLCYWAPAAAWNWRVWVVSPLVSLIQDQAAACEALGLRVAAWHGGLSTSEKNHLRGQMEDGQTQIVFLSPERLVQWWGSGGVEELEALGRGPDLLALDEMHCFENWRSFRSGYQDAFLPVRRLAERGIPLLGLSASLSRADAEAWMNELCDSHVNIATPLGRANLSVRVQAIDQEKERWLLLAEALKDQAEGESSLVYCATRDEADEVSRWLRSVGFRAVAYHAGLPPSWKRARSQAFRRGLLPIVCATSAFGMGIDYPKVRRVIHFSLPTSIEGYWQEVGRAGRDGKPAFAVAFWLRSEIRHARWLNEEAKPAFLSLWRALASGKCRRQMVAEHFGLEEKSCGACDRCEMQQSPAKARPDPWWVQPEARLAEWAREKIFSSHENS